MISMVIMLLKVIVVFIVLLTCVAYLTWLERKVLGHMQVRYGPMRTGWHGLLQPIADGIKLFFKEDIVVEKANKVIYVLAPFIVAVCAFASFAVVPFGNVITLFGHTIDLRVADVDIGILYIFALGSMNVYGVTLAGQLAVALIPMGVFGTKVFLCLFFFIWLRATYPRLRYDQLMEFGWKVLFPLALFNIIVTALLQMVNLL